MSKYSELVKSIKFKCAVCGKETSLIVNTIYDEGKDVWYDFCSIKCWEEWEAMKREDLKAQIEIIRKLLDEFEKKLEDRSFWKNTSKPDRVKEVEAIIKACEALKEQVKIVIP